MLVGTRSPLSVSFFTHSHKDTAVRVLTTHQFGSDWSPRENRRTRSHYVFINHRNNTIMSANHGKRIRVVQNSRNIYSAKNIAG